MKKMVLIDGTNLLFRSYYATATTGRLMRNSKGMPTNALFGFVNMINKIKNEEDADIYVVAFDEGKTFRHSMFEEYKAHRSPTPNELIIQLPYAKPILDGLGVKWITEENYEADDIVGSLARKFKDEYEILCVSSDQDYLQMIDDNVTVKLLKKSDGIYFDINKLKEVYDLKPCQIIDLKSLEGDKSDNIPGVAGVGKVTALKLITEYGSLDGIYENIESVKGKLKEKLINDKENAYFSRDLVTIYTDLDYNLDSLKVEYSEKKLVDVFEELEFHAFLKGLTSKDVEEIKFEYVDSLEECLQDDSYMFFEFFGNHDHDLQLIGASIANEKGLFYIGEFELKSSIEHIFKYNIRTFNYKKLNHYLYSNYNKNATCDFDFMLAFYLLDKRGSEISDFSLGYQNTLNNDEHIYGKGASYSVPNIEELAMHSVAKTIFMKRIYQTIIDEMKILDVYNLYYDVELPLSLVLSKMEIDGVKVDVNFLKQMNLKVSEQIKNYQEKIYSFVGYEFNINSYKQLGKALFEDLKIPYPNKIKEAGKYKTNVEILEKLANDNEVIQWILEYRSLTKLSSTYLEALQTHVLEDGKIHTVYNQALTTTGRLSSTDPNLQNIPVRTEIGKEIRKAFTASSGNVLLACDYSQIELRVLAHLSQCEPLINAFNSGIDIHTKTASDVYGLPTEMIDETMRRNAKAINFGIIYGMSDFGLSKTINVSVAEAKTFISKYFQAYNGIKTYLDRVVSDATIHGYSRTMFNRIRYINELKSNNFMQRQLGERLAMNTPIQGSAADILKIAMIKINDQFEQEEIRSKMILQIHDELIFDCVQDELERVQQIVISCMESAFSTKHIINDNFKVELKVDYGVGNNWFECK